MAVRYHGWQPDGHQQQALTRKAVLIDLADLPTLLEQNSWAGEPIYLMAEHGPLSKWRKSCEN